MQKWSKTLMAGLIAGSLLLGSLPALGQSTYAPRIDAREQRQQQRIQQGIQSGRLTPGEANRLEARFLVAQASRLSQRKLNVRVLRMFHPCG